MKQPPQPPKPLLPTSQNKVSAASHTIAKPKNKPGLSQKSSATTLLAKKRSANNIRPPFRNVVNANPIKTDLIKHHPTPVASSSRIGGKVKLPLQPKTLKALDKLRTVVKALTASKENRPPSLKKVSKADATTNTVLTLKPIFEVNEPGTSGVETSTMTPIDPVALEHAISVHIQLNFSPEDQRILHLNMDSLMESVGRKVNSNPEYEDYRRNGFPSPYGLSRDQEPRDPTPSNEVTQNEETGLPTGTKKKVTNVSPAIPISTSSDAGEVTSNQTAEPSPTMPQSDEQPSTPNVYTKYEKVLANRPVTANTFARRGASQDTGPSAVPGSSKAKPVSLDHRKSMKKPIATKSSKKKSLPPVPTHETYLPPPTTKRPSTPLRKLRPVAFEPLSVLGPPTRFGLKPTKPCVVVEYRNPRQLNSSVMLQQHDRSGRDSMLDDAPTTPVLDQSLCNKKNRPMYDPYAFVGSEERIKKKSSKESSSSSDESSASNTFGNVRLSQTSNTKVNSKKKKGKDAKFSMSTEVVEEDFNRKFNNLDLFTRARERKKAVISTESGSTMSSDDESNTSEAGTSPYAAAALIATRKTILGKFNKDLPRPKS